MGDDDEVALAVTPSLEELRIASDEILRELAGSAAEGGLQRGGRGHTAHLIGVVRERLSVEPAGIPADVLESDLRAAKGIGAAVLALSHLESTGHVLPFGERTFFASVRYPKELSLTSIGGQRSGKSYAVGDAFNYQLAAVYALPKIGLAVEVESPLVFLGSLPRSMGPKVQRVLREAIDAYRSGQVVATTLLLATASEAAWSPFAVLLQNSGLPHRNPAYVPRYMRKTG